MLSQCCDSRLLTSSSGPSQVSLPPYGSASFNVVYSPSSLSTPETGTIELVHPDIGTYVYCVEGSGQLPGKTTYQGGKGTASLETDID